MNPTMSYILNLAKRGLQDVDRFHELKESRTTYRSADCLRRTAFRYFLPRRRSQYSEDGNARAAKLKHLPQYSNSNFITTYSQTTNTNDTLK